MEIKAIVDHHGIRYRQFRRKVIFKILQFFTSKTTKNLQKSKVQKTLFPPLPHTPSAFLHKILSKKCDITKIWRYVFGYFVVIQISNFDLEMTIIANNLKFELQQNNQKRSARFWLYCSFFTKFYIESHWGCGGAGEIIFL